MHSTIGGRTPEELETLLEDAIVLQDGDALSRLFEPGGLLVLESDAELQGRPAIADAVERIAKVTGAYVAEPRQLYQSGDVALLIGEGVINVARRGPDRSWRLAICFLPRLETGRTARRPALVAPGIRKPGRKDEAMHAMIVRMSADPARRDEVKQHFENDVVTWAKNQQGFLSGQWFCTPEGSEAMGVVIFDSEEAANKASEAPRAYGQNERDESRACNIEDVTVYEQVEHA